MTNKIFILILIGMFMLFVGIMTAIGEYTAAAIATVLGIIIVDNLTGEE